MRRLLAVVLTTTLILILLLGVSELPQFGRADNPANNEVMYHYIEKVTEETGAMNIVTGIILDYRAFDTFVEASVLFTAAIVVIMVLKQNAEEKSNSKGHLYESSILKEIGKVVIPFIQVFGLYIIIFGHLSPGGGFSGGTIIGVSLILINIVCWSDRAREKLSYTNLIKFLCAGIILYGVLKGYSFVTGGSHIHSIQPNLGNPGNIISGGYLLPLNILVGIIVAITIYFFFTLFDKGEI
jgi:multicomponent Na+:H+ antiporter subunit B